MPSHNSHSPPDTSRFADLPALARLGLCESDLDELEHQGFLAPEHRGDRTHYKLRFRRDGRQVVRYVGGTEKATLVAQELNTLQTTRRVQRELAKLGVAARQILRDAKTQLEPLLLDRGFKFHGRAIRRPRRFSNNSMSLFSTLSRHGGQ
jgi:hypothetical protein